MTRSREDYIKIIYELGGTNSLISTSDIAKTLKVSKPSVSEMLKKLASEDIIDYQMYKGVKLTKKGKAVALRIKKIHILWEVFLVKKLGYKLSEVHEEAEVLEHITSDKLADALEAYLKYPNIKPYVSSDDKENYHKLLNSEVNDLVIIKKFVDNKNFVKEILSLNIKRDELLKVINKDFTNKLMTVFTNDEFIEITFKQAGNIYVSK